MNTKKLLQDAKYEIERLRRVCEVLQAKVDTMNLFADMLHAPPPGRGGFMSPDIAYELQRAIDEMEVNERVAKTNI